MSLSSGDRSVVLIPPLGVKIVFAGDAVHPLAPASFQAGTQAVEDGATIALCLALSGATQDRVPLALKVYERLRSHRAEKAGELGRKVSLVSPPARPLFFADNLFESNPIATRSTALFRRSRQAFGSRSSQSRLGSKASTSQL